MREYYGNDYDCNRYIQDKDHRAVQLKESTFEIFLVNTTKYTLNLSLIDSQEICKLVEPGESIKIKCANCISNKNGKIHVQAAKNPKLCCDFYVEQGYMASRSAEKCANSDNYIAPLFIAGRIEIIMCKDCGPNYGKKAEYEIFELENPYKTHMIKNNTEYTICISYNENIIQRIQPQEVKQVGFPKDGVIYIDSENQEVLLNEKYYKEQIIRVNGCCFRIKDGDVLDQISIVGPLLEEPYIRSLYSFFDDSEEYQKQITIWCHKYDPRLD